MKIDLAKIDEQIRRLQEVKRIAADPEMLALLDSLRESESPSSTPVAAAEQSAIRVQPIEIRSNGSSHGESKNNVAPKGYLKEAVRKAAFQQTGRFDGYALTEQMRRQGFIFGAAEAELSVMDKLRKMTIDGELELVERGKAGVPNKYEVVKKGA